MTGNTQMNEDDNQMTKPFLPLEVQRGSQSNSTTPDHELKKQRAKARAAILALSVFQTAANLCIKMLHHLPSVQIAFLRSISMLIIGSTYLFFTKKYTQISIVRESPVVSKNLLAYTLYGNCGLMLLTMAVSSLPLAESSVLFFSNAIFNGINGYFLLGLKYTKFEFGMSMISLVGVTLIAKPPMLFNTAETSVEGGEGGEGGASHFLSAIICLGSAFSFSIAYMKVRVLPQTLDMLVVIYAFNLVTLISTSAYALLTGSFVSLSFSDWVLGLICGVFAITFIYLQNRAYQIEKPSRVATISLGLQLVYSTLIDLFVFGHFPDFLSMLGVGAIVGSVYMILQLKH